MAQRNPTALRPATQFRPHNISTKSRSPSRSPVRSSHTATQALDPLLNNLTPESTLEALQATDTISTRQRASSALAKSIADASTFERELGIRAAFAAQRIKEWLKEVSGWWWPDVRERALGVGFLSLRDGIPDTPQSGLSALQVKEYERRVSEIEQDLKALDIDGIKDYVLDAHAISSWMSDPVQHASREDRASYGRMRDFTALITATVIRALPDLSSLNALLGIWRIRTSVLKQIPKFLKSLEQARSSVRESIGLLKLEKWAASLTRPKFEMVKNDLSEQVASIGAAVDKMLDLLEGHDDRLPQTWIDTLENVELDFATWVVEAQRRLGHNEMLARQTLRDKDIGQAISDFTNGGTNKAKLELLATVAPPSAYRSVEASRSGAGPPSHIRRLSWNANDEQEDNLTPQPSQAHEHFTFPLPADGISRTGSGHKPYLTLDLPKSGHRRDVSEVSMAESAISAFSDISQASIVDATSQSMAVPKVNVVQNHNRANSVDLSTMLRKNDNSVQSMRLLPQEKQSALGHTRSRSLMPFRSNHLDHTSGATPSPSGSSLDGDNSDRDGVRPPLLQRASTASMELIGQSQVRRVNLSRSASQDLSHLAPAESKDVAQGETPGLRDIHRGPDTESGPGHGAKLSTFQDASDSAVSPRLALDSDVPSSPVSELEGVASPNLPRRSSKRVTTPMHAGDEQLPSHNELGFSSGIQRTANTGLARSLKGSRPAEESFDAKIQDILTTLPNPIRLATDSDNPGSASQANSTPSARSSSPAPALVLSPAKKENSARRNATGDSEVRVYHLSRAGQARDAPIKLFVRLVGENGERVMVRVGGGWADLGEYLREYSSHHGKRNLADGGLEVASFPTAGVGSKEGTPELASRTTTGLGASKPRTRTSSSPNTPFDWTSLPDVNVHKTRNSSGSSSGMHSPDLGVDEAARPLSTQVAPPVPSIPQSYTIHSPTTVSTTTANGTFVDVVQPEPQTSSSHFRTTMGSPNSANTLSSTTTSPTTTSNITAYSPTTSSTNKQYTPLGAAGPKSAARRAVTVGAPENEAWVQGMVGKARAVSGGGTTTTSTGPSFTTTTTFSSSSSPRSTTTTTSTPLSRRLSGNLHNDSPLSGRASPGPASGRSSPATSEKRKSRLSLGDVSGIRRVFLRKKSDR